MRRETSTSATASSAFIRFVMKIIDSKYGLILILVTVSLIIGFFIVDDFGLSWDEYKDISYGESILKAYEGSDDFLWSGGNRKLYGPFYWMMVSLITRFVQSLGADIFYVDIWKYVNFLVFVMAVFSFYVLSTRFMKKYVALLTTLLFMTQPLLFGHAFINAKDIPFMSFFLTSFVVGIVGVDTFQMSDYSKHLRRVPIGTLWGVLKTKWRGYGNAKKATILGAFVLLLVLVFDLFVANTVILPWMEDVLRRAYGGTATGIVQWLFARIAGDADTTPLEMYLEKLSDAYELGRIFIVIVFLLVGSSLWSRFSNEKRSKPNTREWVKAHYIFILAGVILGLTASIRTAAPIVGVFISMYFLSRSRQRALIPVVIYWVVAMIAMFVTWPYLWGSPYDRFVEGMTTSASFIQRSTLFQGEIVKSTTLPWYYLPWLMVSQFTEPAVLLSILGIIIGNLVLKNGKGRKLEFVLLLLWAAFPAVLIILFRIPIYDNFRQLLFTIPPFLVFAGIGFSFLLRRIKKRIYAFVFVLIVLVPGLVSIVKLHPYEYIFYNSILGGVDGAYSNYELDYWCTSLREAMNRINRIAPPNSSIFISGPDSAAIPFAREDLKISGTDYFGDDLDFVVACREQIFTDDFYPDFEMIFDIRKGNGVLSLVKARK